MNKQTIDASLMASPKLWRESFSQQQARRHPPPSHRSSKKIQPYEKKKMPLDHSPKAKQQQQFYKQEDIIFLSPSKQYLDLKLQTDTLLPSIQEENEQDASSVKAIQNGDLDHGRPKKEKTRPYSLHMPTLNPNLMIPTATTNTTPTSTISMDSYDTLNQKRHTMCLSKNSNNPGLPTLDIPSKPIKSNDINSVKNDSTENKRVKSLRFNVVQLASLTSERDLDYELSISINDKVIDTRYGQMKKLSKKMSSCTFSKNWMNIQVDTPFELTFIIKTKPAHSHKVSDFFTRRGQWSLWKKGKGISSISSSTDNISTIKKKEVNDTALFKSTENNNNNNGHPQNIDFSTISPSGYVRIFSGEQFDFIKQGKYRYKFNKSLSSLNYSTHTKAIEVVVDFQWYYRSVTEPSLSTDGSVTQLSQEYSNLNLTDSMKLVHHGEVLTFYYWGNGLPEWRRYWTVIEGDKLILKPCGYKKKESLYSISLKKLVKVSKPTEEDQENIYLSRQLGVVLQFDTTKMQISERVKLGKMYILTDNKSSAESWRHALSNIKPIKSNNEEDVDNRFLW
ncbi:hypothetical protein BJ944DRAFT_112030 [Cunninghamella echinulata]|nr:hypothetical protein BJ944DRAFT_112030 [Cunninghamella echinulata]